ncbi:hypothetical protein [Streptomyces bikiniensis]|uniref:hypothetical protein n=1 Tax=Streptomyces bikiniensis TaxID=1896 RepID=UPI00052627FE|nr:hypothetical protein [Streptomyces bikiniensis]
MTAPPERKHRVPRAGRTGGEKPWSIWSFGDLCGYCCGKRSVWCPDCGGFAGCGTCGRALKIPCPACSGGLLEKWTP